MNTATPKNLAAHDTSLPTGFRAHTGAAGLRETGDDFAVIITDSADAVSSAVFTQSLFAGASVVLSREHAVSGRARGMVIVAKNSNVATGEQGMANAREVVATVAATQDCSEHDLLLASTGVIGRQYPMDLLRAHIASLPQSPFDANGHDVATAIMTTDTFAKTSVTELATTDGGTARVVGIAKGVGMIEPDMATMIAVILTDARVPAADLDQAFRAAVDESFNCLSVDTDTSTSDTAVALASGAAGPVDPTALSEALRAVCTDLTTQLARDGEGATKLLTVTVTGARDAIQAKLVAKAIVNSPLVKTAVHGADPNWGRVAMAIGKCSDQTDINPDNVRIVFGDLETYPAFPGDAELERLSEIMAADEVAIAVDLGVRSGPDAGRCTVYGCDLSRDYIAINADYTT